MLKHGSSYEEGRSSDSNSRQPERQYRYDDTFTCNPYGIDGSVLAAAAKDHAVKLEITPTGIMIRGNNRRKIRQAKNYLETALGLKKLSAAGSLKGLLMSFLPPGWFMNGQNKSDEVTA